MPQNNKPQIQQPNPRTTIISVVLFLLVAFFVGQQFMSMSQASQGTTDKLVASEFMQAVDQNRVTEVTYSAGDYTINGTYYPAITAGSSAADAFNSAIDAMNAGMATLKDPTTGKALTGLGTTDVDQQTLGTPHKFTCTWAGSSLSDLMAQHPEIKYEVQTPSPWGDILTSLLPIILIGAMLFFLFNQMSKANNSQMNFGKAKAKQNIEERPDVHFSDVAGVDEAVEEMQEIKDFLAAKRGWRAPGPARRAGRSSAFPAPTSLRCSWAWAHRACATCSSRRRKPARPSSSSTRSMPSVASVAPAWAAATTNASKRSTSCWWRWMASRRTIPWC